ncbi:MAG: SH3 domain-containing protein [Fulvimarina manganoxydans]|uniref:SH3 domain-containing protein n=1 Tax=Fulvimarina manganoxydans TaxID=937218 RepID=UPI00235637D7|nr:SH3 domain-containing protein [Fulvimarina manganoxydans]MCK5931290.1 SH3 domain-containing protein [Fulvimarina manganoxydans]
MKRMLTLILAATTGIGLAPSLAHASSKAFATTDVNLRAGPSTSYPAVDVVRDGDPVRVFGCLQTRSWCDVSYGGARGWMSSNYLAYQGPRYRYEGTRAVEVIEAPVITFSLGGYWGDHYRSRDFYRDRARYDRDPDWRDHRRDERWDRRDERWDRRHDRRDARYDRDYDRDRFRDRDRWRDHDGRRDRDWDRRGGDYGRRGPAVEEPVVPLYRVD